MNNALPDHDVLFEEAMTLIIRLQSDHESQIVMDLARQWCARSLDHELIWKEASEIHGMSGKVLSDQQKAGRRAKFGPTRRNLMIGAGIGIGALVAGKLVLPRVILASRADQTTATAEVRPIRLPDGSVATMGPETAIALAYSDAVRRVDLLEGMIYFEVADDGRPFQIVTESLIATSSDAWFDVSCDSGSTTISVKNGVADVRVSNASAIAGEKVGAGKWLSVQDGTQAVSRGICDATQIGAWRDGLIVAEHETVASLLTRIGRWQNGRIVSVDPTIGSRRVSGVYDLTQPTAALEAVVHPFGGVVRKVSSYLTIISPI